MEYYFCLNCEMIVKLDNSPTKFLCECCHRPETRSPAFRSSSLVAESLENARDSADPGFARRCDSFDCPS